MCSCKIVLSRMFTNDFLVNDYNFQKNFFVAHYKSVKKQFNKHEKLQRQSARILNWNQYQFLTLRIIQSVK